MKLYCNWIPRLLLDWYQLTEKEKKEFSYLDTSEKQNDASFFRYRNWVYELGEFMRIETNSPLSQYGFDGYSSDSFYSGILVKYCEDNDYIICATYIS